MKTLIYVPVYIEGKEENLPKEKGYYIASVHNYAILEEYYNNDVKKEWLIEVEYWLKPVELPDEETASNKADEFGEREDSNRKKFIDGNYAEGFMDCYNWLKSKILK